MAEDKKSDKPDTLCKFARSGNRDYLEPILRTPTTVAEWKESVVRCMELVDERLDIIERQIREKSDKD